jgi:fructosamine-3-kinase
MEKQAATEIVRRLVDPSLTVTAVTPLTGGMVNTVLEWSTDGDPPVIVAKVSTGPKPADFTGEHRALGYHRKHGTLAVPAPLAVAAPGDLEALDGSCLLLEKVPGRNMGEARISRAGLVHLQRDMAEKIAHLHDHRRDQYGPATGEGTFQRWVDHFGPKIRYNFEKMSEKFSPSQRQAVEDMLDHLDDWLGEFDDPTLLHGDLWATNIMVDDRDPDRPAVAAFLDGGASFHEVESELAYLLVFNTAGREFFEAYTRRHPLREGFERRCLVYWLNTIMLHVWLFGDEFLPRCKRLADQVAQA